MVKNRKIEDTEREALQVMRVGYRLFGLRVFGVPRFFPFFVSRSLFFLSRTVEPGEILSFVLSLPEIFLLRHDAYFT